MNPGDLRVHWDDPDRTHLYQGFEFLDDALTPPPRARARPTTHNSR